MDRILGDLTSVHWWFSVVVVGLIVGMLGTYLHSVLGGWITRRRENRMQRSARERRQHEGRVAHLKDDEHAQIVELILANDMQTTSLFFWVTGLGAMFISMIVPNILLRFGFQVGGIAFMYMTYKATLLERRMRRAALDAFDMRAAAAPRAQ